MSTEIDDTAQPLMEHLIELRRRLIWSLAAFFVAFVGCFAYARNLFELLVLPYHTAVIWADIDVAKAGMIYTAPQEFFFTQIRVAMFGAMFLAFPVIASQVYKFVAPGLYKNERAAFLPFLVASPLLFILASALVYFFFTPMVMWFFLTMEVAGSSDQIGIELQAKVSEYLSLIMTLVFSFGLVFQLPVVTSLLVRAGLVGSETLADKRKYAVVTAFVVAAVLTPPDPVSQIGLALPTILLYEISIYTARLIERGRKKAKDAEEANEAQSDAGSASSSSDSA